MRPGVVGQAFDFSGGRATISPLVPGPTSSAPAPSPLLSGSTRPRTAPRIHPQPRDPNNFNGEYVLELENGQVNFSIYGDSQSEVSLTTSQTVNDGNWHLIVAERLANGTCQIYIDGALAASDTTAVPLASGFGVFIGEDVRDAVDVGPAYDFNYAGLLEGVQIYNTALTPTQIAKLQTSLAFQIMATTDERGDLHRVGGGLDIGADEYQYDLVVTGTAPASVPSGNLVTYTLTVTNDGPDPVAGATFTDIAAGGCCLCRSLRAGGMGSQCSVFGPGGNDHVHRRFSARDQGGTAQFTIYGNVTSAALSNTDIDDIAAAGPSTDKRDAIQQHPDARHRSPQRTWNLVPADDCHDRRADQPGDHRERRRQLQQHGHHRQHAARHPVDRERARGRDAFRHDDRTCRQWRGDLYGPFGESGGDLCLRGHGWRPDAGLHEPDQRRAGRGHEPTLHPPQAPCTRSSKPAAAELEPRS